MTAEQSISLITAIVELIGVIIWPAVVVFVLLRFGQTFRDFFGNMGELSLKAAGMEATAKRKQVEAAAALGAAIAARPAQDSEVGSASTNAEDIADVVAGAATPRAARRLSKATVLWVDDRPDNNRFERQALEALGVRFILSTDTEDALTKTGDRRFDAIISDMGRPPDPRAGYTLLEALRGRGDKTPFIIYAGSNAPEHKAEAKRRGAQGSTNRADELFELVLSAINA
jgi:CheY-like chemotaxis protein